jgi:hypothetical protein
MDSSANIVRIRILRMGGCMGWEWGSVVYFAGIDSSANIVRIRMLRMGGCIG